MASGKPWEAIQRAMPHRLVKKRIRTAAIRRVRRDLILHNKKEADVSPEDLEYLVADAEKQVISELQKTGLIGVLAMLGLSHF